MKSNPVRSWVRPFTAATVLLGIGVAAAADPLDDLVQRQRQLLTGSSVTASVTTHAQRADRAVTTAGDSQEMIKRVLLGANTPTAQQGRSEFSVRGGSRIREDLQVPVRGVLLGRRDTQKVGL